MSTDQNEEETARSSSAVAESCGALEWRSEPPAEEGWYWCRYWNKGQQLSGPVVKEVYREDGVLMAGSSEVRHYANMGRAEAQHEWAGPIPEPSEA